MGSMARLASWLHGRTRKDVCCLLALDRLASCVNVRTGMHERASLTCLLGYLAGRRNQSMPRRRTHEHTYTYTAEFVSSSLALSSSMPDATSHDAASRSLATDKWPWETEWLRGYMYSSEGVHCSMNEHSRLHSVKNYIALL